MARVVNNLLTEISFHIIEQVLLSNTQLGTLVAAPGDVHINLVDTRIYPGALLVCGVGASLEVITVTSTDLTGFTATFANAHPAVDPLYGATFPSGQPVDPIFTQAEILDYMVDAQNDYLSSVLPVYVTGPVNIIQGQKIYDAPTDAIRVERVSIEGKELSNTTQWDLDTEDPTWATGGNQNPRYWFQDRTDMKTFGVGPLPGVNNVSEVWYPQKSTRNLVLTDSFMVPEPMLHYVKYGTMARMFAKDGEQRDPVRAKYCMDRFDLGVKLGLRFMQGMSAALKTAGER